MSADNIADAGLAYIAQADRLFICSTAPATYAEASSTYNLATVTLTAGDGNGDWTIQDATSGTGREIELAAQTGTVATDGDADFIALGINGSTTLVLGETGTDNELPGDGETLAASNPFNFAAQIIYRIPDPA